MLDYFDMLKIFLNSLDPDVGPDGPNVSKPFGTLMVFLNYLLH